MKKYFLLFIIFVQIGFCGENIDIVQNNSSSRYLDILSNVPETAIFIDGEYIGNTPLLRYKVDKNIIKLKGVVDKDYFQNDITKVVRLEKDIINLVNLDFERGSSTILFIGDDAELYINNKYIRGLNRDNRKLKLEAQNDIKIELSNKKGGVVIYQDLKKNKNLTIKYKLKYIPKDVRLYTSTIHNLMWEDTKHAKNVTLSWDKANQYCKNLKIGGYKDWSLPTYDQLEQLDKYKKNEIYNGFGDKFYWSKTLSKDKSNIWDYSSTINFKDGTTQKPTKSYSLGLVRCVRVLDKPKIEDNLQNENIVDNNKTKTINPNKVIEDDIEEDDNNMEGI